MFMSVSSLRPSILSLYDVTIDRGQIYTFTSVFTRVFLSVGSDLLRFRLLIETENTDITFFACLIPRESRVRA